MKNDYKRTDFKEIKENNSKHYFIHIQNNGLKSPMKYLKFINQVMKKSTTKTKEIMIKCSILRILI